jgi:hypothetical protein
MRALLWLCSFGWRRLRQPVWWRTRHLRAQFWHLFAWSAWAQPDIVVASTTVEGAGLASVQLVGVGPTSHCFWRARQEKALLWPLFATSSGAQPATVVSGPTGRGRCFGLYSFRGRELSQRLCWRIRQLWALLWLLFVWSACCPASHCGGGHYR